MTASKYWWRKRPLPDPSWDLVDCPPVERVVVIASQVRSGSTLLARALRDTGRVGVPGEYLLPLELHEFRARLGVPRPSLVGRLGQLRRRVGRTPTWAWTEHFTRSSLEQYLTRIAELRTTPNGVLCLKIQENHLAVLRNAGLDFDFWGPTPEFIALDRDDRVAQAVSQLRTSQDRLYTSEHPRDPSRPLRYDEARLRIEMDRFEQGAEHWATYFGDRQIEPYRVRYEELDTDYAATMRRLFDHLGLHDVEVGEPPLARVRDQINEEWGTRLRASLAERP